MENFKLLAFLLLVLLPASTAILTAAEDIENRSSWKGLYWSTTKDESELLAKAEPDGAGPGEDEFDGGFSSLDSMLQWAVGNSDPVKLKEKASDVRRLSVEELQKRQEEIKDLMEKLKMPSDAELMQIAIADLNNSSLSWENHIRALNELLVLVEPIDNANDLDKLGGLVAVIKKLNSPDHDVRTISAWILGKACQNNELVQKQIIDRGALPKLLVMINSSQTEEAIKALYAISALIRNNPDGQEAFFTEAGETALQDIMNNSTADIRLLKKVVYLVADLADFQLERSEVNFPFLRSHLFLKSVVDLLSSPNLDLQEKTLLAIRSLLQLVSTEASIFKEQCNLDGKLESMRARLEELIEDDDSREFAQVIENLRHEVHLLFREKLEKVTAVPI